MPPGETWSGCGIVVEIGHQDLEGHVTAHGGIVRAVDDAHRTAADPFDDLIAAYSFREVAPGAIVSSHLHTHRPEQRTTSAVMLSRLPCSSAVLIRDCASTGSS